MLPLVAVLLLVVLLLGILLFLGTLLMPHRLFFVRGAKRRGGHVAEVWLIWPFGRGSTMYRQRFSTRAGAYVAVRLRAVLLDVCLPTFYSARAYDDTRYLERHEYGIAWGVRELAPCERKSFHAVWSPYLPEHPLYRGEHRNDHPVCGYADDTGVAV